MFSRAVNSWKCSAVEFRALYEFQRSGDGPRINFSIEKAFQGQHCVSLECWVIVQNLYPSG